jgi:hypothetical protein
MGKSGPKPIDIRIRFWKHVRKTKQCWVWTANTNNKGYGTIYLSYNRKLLAHRLSYEIEHGEIPSGLNICHKCDNPLCVNPDHLFAGTQKDNIHDCIAKGRSRFNNFSKIQHGENNPFHKLSIENVKDIRKRHLTGERQCVIAKSHGVSDATISMIVNKKRWASD